MDLFSLPLVSCLPGVTTILIEWVDDGTNGKQNLILILTALIAFAGYNGSSKRARRVRSLEFNEKLLSDERLSEAYSLILNISGSTRQKRIDSLLEVAKTEDADRLKLLYYLNTYEALAIGVRKGVYDPSLLIDAQKRLTIRAFEIVKPYIDLRRQETATETLWVEIESLVAKWKKQKTTHEKRVVRHKFMRRAWPGVYVVLFLAISLTPVLIADVLMSPPAAKKSYMCSSA